ncbi:MAG: methionine ABC transporter permease, partial [Lachnospiraceae bacterium]|nr:methionine ABC transporter permease [Lachnospiraceae bacterium]
MFDQKIVGMLLEGIRDTLYMTLVSTLLGYAVGLPLGIVLSVTRTGGLKPNKIVYRILDIFCNIIRSVPFLILLILLIPFTRALVGQ